MSQLETTLRGELRVEACVVSSGAAKEVLVARITGTPVFLDLTCHAGLTPVESVVLE